MKNITLFILMSFALLACEKAEDSESVLGLVGSEEMEPATMKAVTSDNTQDFAKSYGSDENATNVPQTGQEQINSKAKIIRNGSIAIEVGNYFQGISEIRAKVNQFGGYIGGENEENNSNKIANTVVIRVPNEKFDGLVQALTTGDGIKNIDYKRINTRDVTMEYLDMESRIESKTAVLDRYRALLSKATTIKDILEVEDKIRVIQEELESVKGRLKYMKDQVQWSTIHMNVYQNLDYTADTGEKTGFWARLGQAFMRGWNVLLEFLVGLTVIWPFVLLIGGLIFGFFRKRRKSHKNGE